MLLYTDVNKRLTVVTHLRNRPDSLPSNKSLETIHFMSLLLKIIFLFVSIKLLFIDIYVHI